MIIDMNDAMTRMTLAMVGSPSSSASATVAVSKMPKNAPKNSMSRNSTRTTADVRKTLLGRPAPSGRAGAPQPGSGSVERESVSTVTPTAKLMPPTRRPAVGNSAVASAMDMDGLNMKPTSSSTPS